MSPSDPTRGDDFVRRVGATLLEGAEGATTARAEFLRRVAGRSPTDLADSHRVLWLKRLTAAAALLLTTLVITERRITPPPPATFSLSASVVSDDDFLQLVSPGAQLDLVDSSVTPSRLLSALLVPEVSE